MSRLKEEKTLATAAGDVIRHFGNVRQSSSFKRRERIVNKQRAGFVFAKFPANDSASRPQLQGPSFHIMRVTRDKMNQADADPEKGILLRARPKYSGERTARHLPIATLPHPLRQTLRLGPQESVALRMSDHRTQTGQLKIVQRLVHRRGNRYLVEFHEQIIFLVNAKLGRAVLHGHKIFQVKVKIASGGQRQPIAYKLLQSVSALPDPSIIKRKCTIGMRSSHYTRDSVGDGGFRHEQRLLDGLRPIIESRQYVTVQINHKFSGRPQRHHAETACQAPNANIMPANTCRIRRGSKCFAKTPPRIPPMKMPGTNNSPVRQETYPALA